MQNRNIGYFFIVLASIIIVLAGIKSATTIVIPFLLSIFIAIILSPLYN
ncbi:MAG: AI-2E family transporter, partial [Campylobacterota bacterium]|nr:AI-2E family transporter [Campylobacterota bacterium]